MRIRHAQRANFDDAVKCTGTSNTNHDRSNEHDDRMIEHGRQTRRLDYSIRTKILRQI